VISTTCENQIVGKVSLLNKSSLEYCGIRGYSIFLREIKCKTDYEYFSFHRRISEES
jgi:L-rhamnose mutarotase